MADATALAGTREVAHPWFHRLIFGLDRWLQRHYSVIEFTENPDCIFRIQVARLSSDLTLGDGYRAAAGERVLVLHLWNEHVPLMPPEGATLGWARKMERCLGTSLQELARWLESRPDLADITLVRADAVFGTASQTQQLTRMTSRYGFDVAAAPPPSWGERLHHFGENVLISLMVFARNPAALRLESLWRHRLQLLMTRDRLMSHYVHKPDIT